MIEETVRNFLLSNLDVPVYYQVPKENLPEEFVVIEKTGSYRNDRLTESTFALQSYAPKLYRAMLLNEKVKKAMDAMAQSIDDVTKSELNTDYNFTDSSTKRYRYQAVYVVTHYE